MLGTMQNSGKKDTKFFGSFFKSKSIDTHRNVNIYLQKKERSGNIKNVLGYLGSTNPSNAHEKVLKAFNMNQNVVGKGLNKDFISKSFGIRMDRRSRNETESIVPVSNDNTASVSNDNTANIDEKNDVFPEYSATKVLGSSTVVENIEEPKEPNFIFNYFFIYLRLLNIAYKCTPISATTVMRVQHR
jgi:hypothetical protein